MSPAVLRYRAFWIAEHGVSCFSQWWAWLSDDDRHSLYPLWRRLRAIAEDADQRRGRRAA